MKAMLRTLLVVTTTLGALGCGAVADDDPAEFDIEPSDDTSVESVGGRVVLGPTADAYVRSGAYAGANYGRATRLEVDANSNGTTQQAFLRFSVGNVGAIARARLRLYVINGSRAAAAVRTAAATWGETSVTWNNRPALGAAVGTLGAVTAGTWVELDVTPHVAPNAVLSLAMVPRSEDGADFASRESASNRPQLVLELAGADAGTAADASGDAGTGTDAGTTPDPGTTSTGGARGYLTTPSELRFIAAEAARGVQPYAAAVRDVLARAGTPSSWSHGAISGSQSCTDTRQPAYIFYGGQTAYAKALAFHLTGDRAYAQSVREHLLDLTDTSGFGGETYSGGNQCILNLAWYIPAWIWAADLIEGQWTAAEKAGFQRWLATVVFRKVEWASDRRSNNWGSAGSAAAATIADYLSGSGIRLVDRAGAAQGARAAFDEARQRQIDRLNGNGYMDNYSCGSRARVREDGGNPEELARGSTGCDGRWIVAADSSWGYSQVYLQGTLVHAELLRRRGDTALYDNLGPGGVGSPLRAIRFIIANPNNPSASYDFHNSHRGVLELAYRYYRDRDMAARMGVGTSSRQLQSISGQMLHFATLTHGFASGATPAPPPTTSRPVD